MDQTNRGANFLWAAPDSDATAAVTVAMSAFNLPFPPATSPTKSKIGADRDPRQTQQLTR